MNLSNRNLVPSRNTLVARDVAIGIAATLVFYLSVVFVPVMGIFVGILTPVPTLLSFYRWGFPMGYWIPGGSALAGWLLLSYFGMAQSMPYFMEMLLLGISLGMGLRQHWSLEKTIGGASLLVFGLGTVIFWVTHGGSEGGVFGGLEEELRQAISLTFQQYGAVSPESRLLESSLQNAVPTMVRLLPGGALASILVVSWLDILTARRYCRIHSLPLPPWIDWSQWKTPELLVWILIASGFMLLLPTGSFKILPLNVLIVLGTLYFFQGLAVITFYFERWKVPRIMRAFLYGLLLLQQFASLGAILIGLFDVWFDFRHWAEKRPKDL